MKLIHISDIHLTENGRKIWGVNTLSHFCKTIQKIKRLNGIDGIVISGDLSDDGSRWTYKYIDRTFAEIGIPTYCCPGNHDNLEMFYNGYKPVFYKTCETFKLYEWTFIMLNSAVTGMSKGYFNPETLFRLIQQSKGPVVVVLHHPPIEQEGWLNRKLLENKDEFNVLIQIYMANYDYTHINFRGGKHIAGLLFDAIIYGKEQYEKRKMYESE